MTYQGQTFHYCFFVKLSIERIEQSIDLWQQINIDLGVQMQKNEKDARKTIHFMIAEVLRGIFLLRVIGRKTIVEILHKNEWIAWARSSFVWVSLEDFPSPRTLSGYQIPVGRGRRTP